MAAGRVLQRLLGLHEKPEEPFLRRVAEGGANFGSVVFTRNARVMVSVGDGGKTLRVHEIFRDAPAEVQRAIGEMFGRARPRQAAARETIRDFVGQNAPPPSRPVPRRRRARPGDTEILLRLRAEFDRVNDERFGGALPRVPIHLSGRMKRRNGHFSSSPPEIVISRTLCLAAAAGEAERTLRHEMIHLWQHHSGTRIGHGPDFRRMARELDIHPRATRAVEWCER
jgi:hypothetical protein